MCTLPFLQTAPIEAAAASNGFSAQAVESELSVEPDKTATLQVKATVDAGELHYQWYDGSYNKIENAVAESYTTDPVKQNTQYYCQVSDDNGNRRNVWFYIRVDSGFAVNNNSTSLKVAPDKPATLKVDASVKAGKLHYQWYQEDADSHQWTAIENATEASYTTAAATKRVQYYCQVSDDYGNSNTVYITLNVDSGFSVKTTSSTQKIAPNATPTLKAEASVKIGELHYQWYHYNKSNYRWEAIEKATAASFVTPAITAREQYYCQVSDDYGNSNNVNFTFNIDSGFTAAIESNEVLAAFDKPATLKVNASIKLGKLHYQWSQYDNTGYGWKVIETATAAAFTTEAIAKPEQFRCIVSDDYGNSENVSFQATVDSGFTVNAYDTTLNVAPNETVALKVEATVKTGELHYKWYQYDNNRWDAILLDSEVAGSYTTAPITKSTRFYCSVTDDFGNRHDVMFYVNIDSGFTAKAVKSNVAIAPNEKATLQVSASVNMGKLHYQWYQVNGGEIEGAVAGTYQTEALAKNAEYYCVVSDDYGNSQELHFYVRINSGFTAKAVQSDLSVAPGKKATLQVSASVKLGKLHYAWYQNTGNGNRIQIAGAEGDSYVIEAVAKNENYYCRVSDDYGNERNLWFYVRVDSGFTVAEEEREVSVAPNEKAALQVKASVKVGALHYQWYQLNKINGSWIEVKNATAASYTTGAITERTERYCQVSDDYGNSRTVWFTIRIASGFTVATEDTDLSVKKDETAKLQVSASVKLGKIHYQWYRLNDRNTDWVKVENGGTNACTTAAITKATSYYCQINDDYGNSKSVHFHILVDSGFSAEAVEEEPMVELNKTATLQVKASVKIGELHYQWYRAELIEEDDLDGNHYSYVDWLPVEGAVTNTCTTEALAYTTKYYCYVSDDFGNSKSVNFQARVNTGLTAEPTVKSPLFISAGESVTLAVKASVNTGSLRYQWYTVKIVKGEDGKTYDRLTLIDGATDSSYTAEKLNEQSDFACTVTDDYRNDKRVLFTVIPSDESAFEKPVWTWDGATAATVTFKAKAEGQPDLVMEAEVSSSVTAATCNKEGATVYTAAVTAFGKSFTDTKTETIPVDLTAHQFDDGKVTKEATKDADGVKTYTCTVCGATKTEVIPKTGADTPTDVSPTDAQRKPGDVNGDGKVGSDDARLALRRSVGLETFAEGSAEYRAADVNADGKVGSDDARLILRASVGLEDPSTFGKKA